MEYILVTKQFLFASDAIPAGISVHIDTSDANLLSGTVQNDTARRRSMLRALAVAARGIASEALYLSSVFIGHNKHRTDVAESPLEGERSRLVKVVAVAGGSLIAAIILIDDRVGLHRYVARLLVVLQVAPRLACDVIGSILVAALRGLNGQLLIDAEGDLELTIAAV